jgi:hypothetical protein
VRPIETRIRVSAQLEAWHTDPHLGEGRHKHTWTVTIVYPGKPFRDARALKVALEIMLSPWQGTDLHRDLWASEDMAATILRIIGFGDPLGVILTRDDGCDAEAWWA